MKAIPPWNWGKYNELQQRHQQHFSVYLLLPLLGTNISPGQLVAIQTLQWWVILISNALITRSNYWGEKMAFKRNYCRTKCTRIIDLSMGQHFTFLCCFSWLLEATMRLHHLLVFNAMSHCSFRFQIHKIKGLKANWSGEGEGSSTGGRVWG